MTNATEAPALPEVWIVPDELVAAEAELDPPYRVLIHNDDVTPMEFVVIVLRGIFHLSMPQATSIMLTAHFRGLAYVVTLPLEEAKYRVGKAHAAARANEYPLTFTIEPERQ
jgi:ATP-dependent Clp protease adaptor protein ClpS